MYVNRAQLVEVGDMEEVYRHPYDWSVDGGFISEIADVVERSGGRGLTTGAFVDCAGRALSLTTDSETLDLPGIGRSWRNRRYRFIVEVILEERSRYQNTQTRAIVTGYTDRAEISLSKMVEPETRFHVNSVVTVKDMVDGRGNPFTRVVDMSQTVLGNYDGGRDQEYMIRPSDLFAKMESSTDLLADSDEHIDTRSTFHTGMQLTNRRENTAGAYLFNLISTDISAEANCRTMDTDFCDESRDVVAYDQLSGRNVRNNLFLRTMASRDNDFTANNYFTYDDLADFVDGGMKVLDSITDVITMERENRSYESERWGGASGETLAAYQACHAIPVIMLDCCMDYISFSISNERTHSGQPPEFFMHDMGSYIGENFNDRRIVDAFEARLANEVFKLITNNNYMMVDMSVSCELGGVTTVEISIEGEAHSRYVFPSFADALITPVVTSDLNRGDDLVDGYLEIRKTVDEITGRQSVIDTTTSLADIRKRNARTERAEHRREQPSYGRDRSLHNLIDDDVLGNGSFNLKSLDDL